MLVYYIHIVFIVGLLQFSQIQNHHPKNSSQILCAKMDRAGRYVQLPGSTLLDQVKLKSNGF